MTRFVLTSDPIPPLSVGHVVLLSDSVQYKALSRGAPEPCRLQGTGDGGPMILLIHSAHSVLQAVRMVDPALPACISMEMAYVQDKALLVASTIAAAGDGGRSQRLLVFKDRSIDPSLVNLAEAIAAGGALGRAPRNLVSASAFCDRIMTARHGLAFGLVRAMTGGPQVTARILTTQAHSAYSLARAAGAAMLEVTVKSPALTHAPFFVCLIAEGHDCAATALATVAYFSRRSAVRLPFDLVVIAAPRDAYRPGDLMPGDLLRACNGVTVEIQDDGVDEDPARFLATAEALAHLSMVSPTSVARGTCHAVLSLSSGVQPSMWEVDDSSSVLCRELADRLHSRGLTVLPPSHVGGQGDDSILEDAWDGVDVVYDAAHHASRKTMLARCTPSGVPHVHIAVQRVPRAKQRGGGVALCVAAVEVISSMTQE